MAEWSKAPHSKCGVPVTVPRVRIPISPPIFAHPYVLTKRAFGLTTYTKS